MRLWPIALADAAVLVATRPAPHRLAEGLSDPASWLDRAGTDRAAATVAGAALWCVALWVGVSLLACLLAAAPGAAGRLADRVACLLLPAALYRMAAGAVGLGVVLAPVAAGATPAPVTAGVSTASSAPVGPAPAWPSDRPLPAPNWPTTQQPAAHPHVRNLPTGRPNRPTERGARPTKTRAGAVVVRRGDSLWSIAAAHLPPDASSTRIAREWPRWYGANRAVIGDDAALIRPGQVLTAPAGPSAQEDRP